MTPAEVAYVAGASTKWVDNTRRVLGIAKDDGPGEARWLGIVHELHATLRCTLAIAAEVASAALAAPVSQRELRVQPGGSGGRGAALVIDLWREHSVYLARLSRVLARPEPDRRGRPPRRDRRSVTTRAVEYGVDVERLRAGLSRTPAERLRLLDANAAFLAAGRSRGRAGGRSSHGSPP